MSIIFHEGLPGSGKSYEAVVCHLIPALKKGRFVVTNIKGIDLQKISDLINKPVHVLQDLIKCVPWEATKGMLATPVSNALYLIDEVQDFWPSVKDKMTESETEFVTQHRHFGIDVILMGQALKDIHNLWRNRVDKKFYFIKKDSVGKPTHYQWHCYKRTGPDKFTFVNDGGGKYEEKYFGVYASHKPETENTESYNDSRANIWNRPSLKYGIPVFACAFVVAAYFIGSVFFGSRSLTGGKNVQGVIKEASAASLNGVEVYASPHPQEFKAGAAVPAVPVYSAPVVEQDQLADLMKNFRPRLAALVSGGAAKVIGKVDFFDGSFHRHESFSFAQIEILGGKLLLHDEDVILTAKNGFSMLVSSWPLFDQAGQIATVIQQSPSITGKY